MDISIKRLLLIGFKLPIFVVAVPVVLVIRLINPWFLVRFGAINSSRIGHFAGNTEIYLCELDAGLNRPLQRYVDFFYMSKPICNDQLAIMCRRVLRVWPSWILIPIVRINSMLPGGTVHDVGNNTMQDQDVHNLLERYPTHLEFLEEEKARGEVGLLAMGIPIEAPFICLTVRDSAYLSDSHWSYHNYRDSNVQNYILAAKELADRGYFVIRMGAKVHEAMNVSHPKIIDYATNGMRSDFMDIYLGAKCSFCISTSTGWDAIPYIFRKPVAYVNLMSLGYLFAIRRVYLAITKHHVLKHQNRELTLKEIFTFGVAFSGASHDYESKGLQLLENTPEEIRDVAIEMLERLSGKWKDDEDDELLQKRFWEIFPEGSVVTPMGQTLYRDKRSRYGSAYLRNNRNWLQ